MWDFESKIYKFKAKLALRWKCLTLLYLVGATQLFWNDEDGGAAIASTDLSQEEVQHRDEETDSEDSGKSVRP